MRRHRVFAIGCLAACLVGPAPADERIERFDRDPNWDGHNNHSSRPAPRSIRQDFGYSRTAHAGGEVGEVGGFLSPAAEPAYYARRIPAASLNDVLTASVTLALDGRPTHALILDRFGIVTTWVDGNGQTIYFDDLTYTCRP